MTEPALTICVPHLDRSDHLQYAIDSCLGQTVPVKVVVADQGRSDKTKALMDRYADHPNVRHILSPATCLWQNWKFAIDQADTPYASWLQDDDIVSRVYASRIIRAFAEFPDALHWQARCYCASPDRTHAVWFGVNGPQCGLRMIDMGQERWPGGYLLASMFVTAWALSPGVAFRRGPELAAALDGMPESGCDLFAERLIVAAMGAQGSWVADPVTAGYWVMHGGNEHHRQNADGSLPAQRTAFIAHMDSILDGFPAWGAYFSQWLITRSPQEIGAWINGWECKESRYSDALLGVMLGAINGRAVVVPAKDRGPDADADAPDPCVIYEGAAA